MAVRDVSMREKQVVSLYMDYRLWHQFGLACDAHETTRGRQLVKMIETRLAQWQRADAKRKEA